MSARRKSINYFDTKLIILSLGVILIAFSSLAIARAVQRGPRQGASANTTYCTNPVNCSSSRLCMDASTLVVSCREGSTGGYCWKIVAKCASSSCINGACTVNPTPKPTRRPTPTPTSIARPTPSGPPKYTVYPSPAPTRVPTTIPTPIAISATPKAL